MSDVSNNESDQGSPKGRTSESLGKQVCQKDLSISPQESKQGGFLTIRQQNAQKLLFEFAKTFISVMESTLWAKSDPEEDEEGADEYCDNFGANDNATSLGIRMNSIGMNIGKGGFCIGSGDSIESGSGLQPISDEEFPYEKYFPIDQKDKFRSLFTSVAFDIFQSYEYQLVILVKEKRKISEIAEDIVHRILDNFKESQRGFNPEYIKPEITREFLIVKALHHDDPEGIIYNSEWNAVEILENPGTVVKSFDKKKEPGCTKRMDNGFLNIRFYQSHWQKNFVGVKKLIGYKYGFRLNFDFESEEDILRNFEKVPISSVSPLYLNYEYCLDSNLLQSCKDQLIKALEEEDKESKIKTDNLTNDFDERNHNDDRQEDDEEDEEEKCVKDRVRVFQSKLQSQKLEEEKNSDTVMKQIVNLSHRFETLHSKLAKLEQKGVINSENVEEVNRAKSALLRSNYHVRFEVRDPNTDCQILGQSKK